MEVFDIKKDDEIKQFLISEIKRFYKEHKRIPMTIDLDGGNGYPSRKKYSKYFGTLKCALLESGFSEVEIINSSRNKPLPPGITKFNKENLKDLFFQFVDVYGYIPTLKELEETEGYPTRNDYRKEFGSWTAALKEFGVNPVGRTYTDDELENEFLRFVEENGRVPTITEFNNSEYPSFWNYQNRFGSWTNAVKFYGYNPTGRRSLGELKKDIKQLCDEIYKKENRKIISYEDIVNSPYCMSVSTYIKHFKKELGITLRDFVNSIGFDLPRQSTGMIHEYADGEITLSKYEFMVSEYLRNNNVTYERDVFYKEFIKSYSGNKDCDYIIDHEGIKWFVEVAGMYDDVCTSKIGENYKRNLKEKIQMLKKQGLNYIIIYPKDFQAKSMDEIFSFLHK